MIPNNTWKKNTKRNLWISKYSYSPTFVIQSENLRKFINHTIIFFSSTVYSDILKLKIVFTFSRISICIDKPISQWIKRLKTNQPIIWRGSKIEYSLISLLTLHFIRCFNLYFFACYSIDSSSKTVPYFRRPVIFLLARICIVYIQYGWCQYVFIHRFYKNLWPWFIENCAMIYHNRVQVLNWF